MSDQFVGEIRMFAGTFAPSGWALCNGQLLAISSNDALFSLLGTIYGGNGRDTFGLPDLRGRVPIHMGTGAGLSPRPIGQEGGSEMQGLSAAQLPTHTHTQRANPNDGTAFVPTGNVPAKHKSGAQAYAETADTAMNASAVASAGGGQAHANVMPFIVINYIIALVGIYPSQN